MPSDRLAAVTTSCLFAGSALWLLREFNSCSVTPSWVFALFVSSLDFVMQHQLHAIAISISELRTQIHPDEAARSGHWHRHRRRSPPSIVDLEILYSDYDRIPRLCSCLFC